MDLHGMAKALASSEQKLSLRWGVVTATSPLTITLGGSATPIAGVKRLGNYTPTLSDTVAVLVNGADLLVLGKAV